LRHTYVGRAINKLEKVATARNVKAIRHRDSRPGPFWPSLYCACIQTASQLPIEIVTLPLDTLTPTSDN